MMITGYQIRHALKRLEQRRNVATKQFEDALFVYEGEEKPDPRELAGQIREAEAKIARLQVAQARYNLAVEVAVQGETMTLHEAVKRVGGAGRLEGLWQKATSDESDPWGYNRRARSTDQEYAEAVVPANEALELVDQAASHANALREAIALGNAVEREIDGIDESLFA